MKKLLIVNVFVLMLSLLACQKEDPNQPGGKGNITVGIGLSLEVNELGGRLKSTPVVEDFKVSLFKEDGSELMVFQNLSVMPDTIELEPGKYYVEAHSNNNLPAAFENPYYYGVSDVFTLNSNDYQTILVNCLLANTIISVVYSESLATRFLDYSTTVSNDIDSLIFSKEETRKGYFQPQPLTIRARLVFLNPDGTENIKTLEGSIPEPIVNKHYEISVNASIDNGLSGFQILMDDSEAETELIELTEGQDSAIQVQPGEIAYGDLLITEIMPDPSALSDTEGEWFEVYNNSDQIISLQDLVIKRDELNQHIIDSDAQIMPGEYFVFEKTETATEAGKSYVFGSDILLPNTGAVLAIYNKETNGAPGSLIFAIDYGENDFPSGSGASLSLNPGNLNASEAVLGSFWCLSVSDYGLGDLGTPGMTNDICP
jgi:Domain of unknown function (DUF4493)/Lamin Tail Domain